MLLYQTFIPNQIHYIMLGIKLGIKIKNFKLSYKVSSFPFAFSSIGFSVSPPATFAFITSSFAFRDTLSAGASAYCLMPLSCPVPTVFSASGIILRRTVCDLFFVLWSFRLIIHINSVITLFIHVKQGIQC